MIMGRQRDHVAIAGGRSRLTTVLRTASYQMCSIDRSPGGSDGLQPNFRKDRPGLSIKSIGCCSDPLLGIQIPCRAPIF